MRLTRGEKVMAHELKAGDLFLLDGASNAYRVLSEFTNHSGAIKIELEVMTEWGWARTSGHHDFTCFRAKKDYERSFIEECAKGKEV